MNGIEKVFFNSFITSFSFQLPGVSNALQLGESGHYIPSIHFIAVLTAVRSC